MLFEPGDEVEPIHYVFTDLEDEDADPAQIVSEKITVSADTSFSELDLGDDDYIFIFEMEDIQRNSYLSEAVMMSVVNGEVQVSKSDAQG